MSDRMLPEVAGSVFTASSAIFLEITSVHRKPINDIVTPKRVDCDILMLLRKVACLGAIPGKPGDSNSCNEF
jgi:hypothetical protein